MEEIAKHKTVDSLWIVIEDKVYDITSFLEEHPGGQKPLLKYAGTNATEKFNSVSMHIESVILPELLEKICIGSVKLSIQ
jgi:cytochrome b involved in lipid metabolism